MCPTDRIGLQNRLARPSIAPLKRLQTGLLEEQGITDERADIEWPRAFRLKEGQEHSADGEDLRPGDVISLTEEQFAAYGDKFEAV